ncbi:MAG: hypothetical protein JSW66_05510 [Phycisphaerales bacterium]|nr:MAG: hypothetical protein JSW66_05510 [Phycisphaerales bacterium]
MNLQSGIENDLDAKLDAALKAIDDLNENNDVAGIPDCPECANGAPNMRICFRFCCKSQAQVNLFPVSRSGTGLSIWRGAAGGNHS